MAGQDSVPTDGSAAHQQHPAVTPSQASNTQSQPAVDGPAPAQDPAASGQQQGGVQPAAATATQQHEGSADHPAGLLPLPPPPSESGEGGDATTTIEVNGARVSLADRLGPVVVNEDGTMSRIANWGEMSDIEKRNTVRILGARNRLRLDALRGGGGSDGSNGTSAA